MALEPPKATKSSLQTTRTQQPPTRWRTRACSVMGASPSPFSGCTSLSGGSLLPESEPPSRNFRFASLAIPCFKSTSHSLDGITNSTAGQCLSPDSKTVPTRNYSAIDSGKWKICQITLPSNGWKLSSCNFEESPPFSVTFPASDKTVGAKLRLS